MMPIMTRNNRGSALVITMMLLLILTAIGIYAVSISTTEMNIAIQSRVGAATLNAADAGANIGIDLVPEVSSDNTARPLFGGSQYVMTSLVLPMLSLRAGYGSNYRFADFQVTSEGRPPPQFTGRRRVEAVVDYGPVPVGTMY